MTATRLPWLNQTHGGYYHSTVPSENEELTHVGPGTPCGEYLRCYWQPVAVAAELKDLPHAIRIMGEDLVVFRGGNGQVGLLELHCSHRGTSLEFGLIEENGIRCCYHGWMFGVDGRILDTPGEPPDSTYKERLCHGAYPVHEYKGLIFAYMGPPDKIPPFPIYDTYEVPGYRLQVGTMNYKPCNWLQVQDNVMDPVHHVFLHNRISGPQFQNEADGQFTEVEEIGYLEFMETPIGMMYANTRRMGHDVWVHMTEHINPSMAQIPTFPEFPIQYPEGKDEICFMPKLIRWRIPIDDNNTAEFTFVSVPEGQEDMHTKNPGFATMAQLAGESRPYEERQRQPADFEAQVGQRPIAVHNLENLGNSDRGVIMFRKQVREGIGEVLHGQDPKGIVREERKVISTYGCDTMITVAPALTQEEDDELLKNISSRLAERYSKSPPISYAFGK